MRTGGGLWRERERRETMVDGGPGAVAIVNQDTGPHGQHVDTGDGTRDDKRENEGDSNSSVSSSDGLTYPSFNLSLSLRDQFKKKPFLHLI